MSFRQNPQKFEGSADKKGMVPARHVLRSFLFDAIRLSTQATHYVKELAEQARERHPKGGVNPEQVRALYQIIHTLKGTASMVQKGEPIVKALHQLEEQLASQSIEGAAQRPDWIQLARDSISEAHRALMELRNQERAIPLVPLSKAPTGILLRTQLQAGTPILLWFNLSVILRVLLPEELAGRQILCLNGAWVPVLGENEKKNAFGIGMHIQFGKIVLAAEEVLGLVNWEEAQKAGATNGEVILRQLHPASDVSPANAVPLKIAA
ncbi:Hpt domain-containing protein [bacterium]|nr:Hpt domain-containing protein [bacterium]